MPTIRADFVRLHHIVAVNHMPPGITERTVTEAERGPVLAALAKSHDTVFTLRSYDGIDNRKTFR